MHTCTHTYTHTYVHTYGSYTHTYVHTYGSSHASPTFLLGAWYVHMYASVYICIRAPAFRGGHVQRAVQTCYVHMYACVYMYTGSVIHRTTCTEQCIHVMCICAHVCIYVYGLCLSQENMYRAVQTSHMHMYVCVYICIRAPSFTGAHAQSSADKTCACYVRMCACVCICIRAPAFTGEHVQSSADSQLC